MLEEMMNYDRSGDVLLAEYPVVEMMVPDSFSREEEEKGSDL